MLEAWAGRLKLQRNTDSIQVLLPKRFNGDAVPVLIFGVSISVMIEFILDSLIRGTKLDLWGILWTALSMAAGVFALNFSTRTILTLTSDELSQTKTIFGIPLRKQTRRNDQIHGLRKNVLISEWTGKDLTNKTVVEINQSGSYRPLVAGLTDAESDTLIAGMMAVYPFPYDTP